MNLLSPACRRRCVFWSRSVLIAALACGWMAAVAVVPLRAEDVPAGARALLAAYPEQLTAFRDGKLVWRDGAEMPYDDGKTGKSADALFNDASLKDQLSLTYPIGKDYPKPPPTDFDPGRYRCEPFFLRMYGRTAAEVERNLAPVAWLGQTVKVTRVNGVNEKLAAVAAELEKLPPALKNYAMKSAGTYYWRKIAKTDRLSAHSFGIAIDINLDFSDYWQWAKSGPNGRPLYRNRIPFEIVEIFERHGFIWGGKWEHYDTMHFEYRPELLPSAGR
jgi:peptidoglycan L-alanyl-D-glutamate endopeptidase CwlK